MKKTLLLLLLIIGIIGCSNKQIDTSEEIQKISEKNLINDKDYIHLNNILKDRSKTNELRLEVLEIMSDKNFMKMKSTIELLVIDETQITNSIYDLALKYDTFNFDYKTKVKILNYLLENMKYNQFLKLYDGEKILLTKEKFEGLISKIEMNAKNLEKIFDLVIVMDNYNLFKDLLKIDMYNTLKYFEMNRKEWILKIVKEDPEIYKSLSIILNQNTYIEYKEVIYTYLNSLDEAVVENSVNLILEYEFRLIDKVLSDNYFLQKEAIKKYGIIKSMQLFEKKLDTEDLIIYRGLAIVNHPEILDILKNKFEKRKEDKILELIFLIKDVESRTYFKDKFKELAVKDQLILLEKLKFYDKSDCLSLAYEVLTELEKSKEKIPIIDFIFKNDMDTFMKFALYNIKFNELEKEEKTYIMDKLNQISEKNTSGQILRAIEKEDYLINVENEKSQVMFSSKIKFWEDYLIEFPRSLYKAEISKRLEIYRTKVSDMEQGSTKDLNQQIAEIESQMQEMKEALRNDSSVERTTSIRNRIFLLEKRKKEILAEYNKSTVDKLKDLEYFYNKVIDTLEGLYQRRDQLKNSEPTYNTEVLIRQTSENIAKYNSESEMILEKIALVYGYFLEEKSKESDYELNADILRKIKGTEK